MFVDGMNELAKGLSAGGLTGTSVLWGTVIHF